MTVAQIKSENASNSLKKNLMDQFGKVEAFKPAISDPN